AAGKTNLDAPAMQGAVQLQEAELSAAHRRGSGAGIGAHRDDVVQGGRLENLPHERLCTVQHELAALPAERTSDGEEHADPAGADEGDLRQIDHGARTARHEVS